jgi:hypothetical protein
MLARIFETVAFVLHLGVVALALVWQRSRTPAFTYKLLGIVALAAFLALGAERGSLHHAAVWEVLASRTLGRLLSQPLPLLPAMLPSAVTLFTLALAVWLIAKAKPGLTALVLTFALLSGGATDVPLLALSLALGTIVAKLPATAASMAPASRAPNRSHVNR